jgi:tetratricopeptide (TPR) repeat protein
LEVDLAVATQWPDTERAAEIADAAAARADAVQDEAGGALARAIAAQMRLQRGGYPVDEAERLAQKALPLLEAAGDDDGLVHLWMVLALVANIRSRYEDWAHASEQALRHSSRAGQLVGGTSALSVALVLGPRPAGEALSTLEAALSEPPHPIDLIAKAVLLAMLGQINAAWELALPSAERAQEIGAGDGTLWLADIAVIAGDAAAAAAYLRKGCDELEKTGHIAVLSTYAPKLGRVLCELGRHGEAERLARRGRELGEPDDVVTQMIWRQVQALVHSARSEHGEAERLAREAVEFIFRSDSLWQQGDALCDLAEVLATAGRSDEALSTLRDALDCYERKQVVPLVDRVRDRISALERVDR